MDRIYLDNAATSWPKPPEVLAAIQDFYLNLGSASGRGGLGSGFSSDHIVQQCRMELAEFLGASLEDELVFAFNGTDAIHIALCGFLNDGDHVVTTAIEHNSVIRPLEEMQQSRKIRVETVDCDEHGFLDVGDLEAVIGEETKLVVVSHASNVTGAIQDIGAIANMCQKKDVCLMIDAAQTVGQQEIDFKEIGCDILVAPGHKGLLGPLGTGFVLISARVKEAMKTWRAGGTGTESELTSQPTSYPAKLESGNLNVGGIAGMLAGLRFVKQVGVAFIGSKEASMIEYAVKELSKTEGVSVYSRAGGTCRAGVLSLGIDGFDPREVAMILDSSFGIQTRAGLHCAPGIHKRMGTFEIGGTVRISPGWFTEMAQMEQFVEAIRDISTV